MRVTNTNYDKSPNFGMKKLNLENIQLPRKIFKEIKGIGSNDEYELTIRGIYDQPQSKFTQFLNKLLGRYSNPNSVLLSSKHDIMKETTILGSSSIKGNPTVQTSQLVSGAESLARTGRSFPLGF